MNKIVSLVVMCMLLVSCGQSSGVLEYDKEASRIAREEWGSKYTYVDYSKKDSDKKTKTDKEKKKRTLKKREVKKIPQTWILVTAKKTQMKITQPLQRNRQKLSLLTLIK